MTTARLLRHTFRASPAVVLRPLFIASLLGSLAACDGTQDPSADPEGTADTGSDTGSASPSDAHSPNGNVHPPSQPAVPTIRFDGQLWLAVDGLVSTLPVFAVRYELPLFETFQIVEQTDASCNIAPAAAWWNHPGDPDAYQTVTTGEGVRHFCAFARDASGAASGAPLAFTVKVDPLAVPPAQATGHSLDKDPTPVVVGGAAWGRVQATVTYVGGFGMRNSGRAVPAAPLAPAATDYASQVVIPAGWDLTTVSFVPPSGQPNDLASWENFAIGYVKSATADENDVRMFGNDVASHGFEPIVAGPNDPPGADLMTKLGHLTPWQIYRLASLFRGTENLVTTAFQWMGKLNGIPDWRLFRRWRDVLWSNVDGDPVGPHLYFGRSWIKPRPAYAPAPPVRALNGSVLMSQGQPVSLVPALNLATPADQDVMNDFTLDPSGLAFWAGFQFPVSPAGDQIENPFNRTPDLQEKAVRLALVTTFYQGLVLSRSIRVSAVDADPANDCRISEYVGPQIKTMFKAIDQLLPLMNTPEFQQAIPALRAMTQDLLHHVDGLTVAGGGGTNMLLPEVAAFYYAVHSNPSDAHWRYLRDHREAAVYEVAYPGITHHQHGSYGWEASYEGNANSHNVELCGALHSPLACGKLYLSNRLKRDFLTAEPDRIEAGVTKIGELKGPSGTNPVTAEHAPNDQGFAASRDQLTDQFFPAIFGYLVAHTNRTYGGLLSNKSVSAYAGLTDVDIARREIIAALTSYAARFTYNNTHPNYFERTKPGVQDWFVMDESFVPPPAALYSPLNFKCGSYSKIDADILTRSTVDATETGGASLAQQEVQSWAQSTLAAPTVLRLPSYASATRPGVVRNVMPRPGSGVLEDTYVRFDGTAYSATFYAGTTGWHIGADYDDPAAMRSRAVTGFGPGLLSFAVVGTAANQTPVQRNLTGPVLLSKSEGGQYPDREANFLDRAPEFAHPMIVGLARPASAPAGCAGHFITGRQRYGLGTQVVETKVSGITSTLALNTRGFVGQEFNLAATAPANATAIAQLQAPVAGGAPCVAPFNHFFPNAYLCRYATVSPSNMSYGAIELRRPNDPATGAACNENPLPFTLEFGRNYLARTTRIDVTVSLKTPNPNALPAYDPPVFLRSTGQRVLFDALDEIIPIYHDLPTTFAVSGAPATGVFTVLAAAGVIVPHGLQIGDVVTLAGLNGGAGLVPGMYTVATVPSPTTFTLTGVSFGTILASASVTPLKLDALTSSKVWTRKLVGGVFTPWARLTYVFGGTNGPVDANQILVARNAGALLIAFPSGTRRVRITAPTEMKNFGSSQNLLVDLLPNAVPAQGFSSTFGAADALNLSLTYQVSPRMTATLPP